VGRDASPVSTADVWLYRPRFPEDWGPVALYDLASWANGMAFRSIHFSPSGRPIIKIAELKNGVTGQTAFSDAEYDDCYLVSPGDILFSWSGQPETSIDVFRWRGPEGWLNQHIFKVGAREDLCEPGFLYYLLRYLRPNFVAIARNKQTIGLGHVTVRDLQHMEIGLPFRDVQRGIAHILGTLDDKIELNRRMNETLEQIAQAIFTSWFVDFDPVRAKAESRQPVGMNAATAALFPDSFEDLPLGKIPRGWARARLGSVIELAYGEGLREQERAAGNMPVFGSNGQVGWHDRALAKGPGIIIGRKGNPGIVTWCSSDFFPIDTTFYVIPKAEGMSLRYLYHALKQQDLPSLSADSVVPGLNRNLAYMNDILTPSPQVLRAFDNQVLPLVKRVDHNDEESHTLAAIRDALLPKLVSGEIRVHSTAALQGEQRDE